MNRDKIIIYDFGSQYTQLIGRRLREMRFYSEILPFREAKKLLSQAKEQAFVRGIILSGGPASVHDVGAPAIPHEIFQLDIPILGICYGLQLMVHLLGGKVETSDNREYGPSEFHIKKNSPLFQDIPQTSTVWMSHADKVIRIPPEFVTLGTTPSSPYAAIGHTRKPLFGLQFHPEVNHTQYGKDILRQFARDICQMKPNWTMKNFAKQKIEEIRQITGNEKVLLGVSGGVDSTVTAKLLHEAIGNRLSCVYIDTGLMRHNETQVIHERFRKILKIPLHVVHAGHVFLAALQGVVDPEQKRKIIGRLFLEEFRKKSLELGHHEFLAQGTLYPDVIESVSVRGPSDTIKSHHNRVREVMELVEAGKVIEPLKELFKDEVRRLGFALKIPREALMRHPFPGPGLAIRIIGEVTRERVLLLQKADAILLEELKRAKYYDRVWQAFAVFLPIHSVGVMGDRRTYDNVVALRIVKSKDGMTANFAQLPFSFLGKVANRIVNEVKGVNRVVYDITSKPPATIEWE
ncbi:MAG: glutamine-hydrolyzing GMP synthase [Leptospiraceae bacterium]|nr:glutamine-hydrolyzing GMP synthase [Leptospiraceae bacterium]MDW8307603.1 glutamine-hydrolyzing GMP synthase [Leptospiraceae bacterium]